ncbi:MAG: tryptophan-rich sensory protein [Lachnospiraceae bacterium]|jgi:tryptophan-rich sensory protein|nr:tryptophan-rich sensory protein [Lachnospiraceae bacterium]
MKFQWKALAMSLAVSLGTGFLSSLLTPNIQEEYAQLYQPPLAPPGWVFPVVWTVLFLLMGLAAFVVYDANAPMEEKKQALILYGVQLLFNLGWSVLFFRWNAYLPAFLWLIILWFFVFLLVKKFGAIDELAGNLMIPYLLWLTFAAYLNLSIALYYL